MLFKGDRRLILADCVADRLDLNSGTDGQIGMLGLVDREREPLFLDQDR